MLIEIAVTAVAWAVQIAAVLLVAFIVAVAVKIVEEVIRKRRVKWFPRVLAAFLLLCVLLAVVARNPIIVCGEGVENRLTDVLREQVRNGAAGLYSQSIPLIPLYIEITELEVDGEREQKVTFFVHYFCAGKQRMEYDTHDGYNSYPMFGLQ